jgi:tryptophan synthase beta chain
MRLGRRLAAHDAEAAPIIVVTLSGRGDKDVDTAIKWFGLDGSADASVGGEA